MVSVLIRFQFQGWHLAGRVVLCCGFSPKLRGRVYLSCREIEFNFSHNDVVVSTCRVVNLRRGLIFLYYYKRNNQPPSRVERSGLRMKDTYPPTYTSPLSSSPSGKGKGERVGVYQARADPYPQPRFAKFENRVPVRKWYTLWPNPSTPVGRSRIMTAPNARVDEGETQVTAADLMANIIPESEVTHLLRLKADWSGSTPRGHILSDAKLEPADLMKRINKLVALLTEKPEDAAVTLYSYMRMQYEKKYPDLPDCAFSLLECVHSLIFDPSFPEAYAWLLRAARGNARVASKQIALWDDSEDDEEEQPHDVDGPPAAKKGRTQRIRMSAVIDKLNDSNVARDVVKKFVTFVDVSELMKLYYPIEYTAITKHDMSTFSAGTGGGGLANVAPVAAHRFHLTGRTIVRIIDKVVSGQPEFISVLASDDEILQKLIQDTLETPISMYPTSVGQPKKIEFAMCEGVKARCDSKLSGGSGLSFIAITNIMVAVDPDERGNHKVKVYPHHGMYFGWNLATRGINA